MPVQRHAGDAGRLRDVAHREAPTGAREHDERRVEDAILRRRPVAVERVAVERVAVELVAIGAVVGSGVARGATGRLPM